LRNLVLLDDSILIDLTLTKLSEEYKINYDVLNNKYLELKNKTKRINNQKNLNIEKKPTKINKYDLASNHLLYYMLKDERIIIQVEKRISFFPNSLIRDFANEIIYYYHKYGVLNIADFISYIANDDEKIEMFKEITNMKLNEEYSEEEIEDYINVVNSFPIKKKVNDLNKKLKEENNPLEQAKILSEILSLKGVKQ